MDRRDELKNNNPNPAKYFLEWRSKDKCFRYWDKGMEENMQVPLPFKFLVLMEFSTIKGWHDPSQSSIYSNEVKYLNEEVLNVRSFKGGPIVKGLYNDIKDEIIKAGGKYYKSIYVMTPDGEICNIAFRGPHAFSWGEFYKKTNKQRALDEWIQIYDTEERKKGSNTFFVPMFQFNGIITEDENTTAQLVYRDLKTYIDGYMARNEKEITEQVYADAKKDAEELDPVLGNPNSPATQDDLPF